MFANKTAVFCLLLRKHASMEDAISGCYFPLLGGMGTAVADEWIQLPRLASCVRVSLWFEYRGFKCLWIEWDFSGYPQFTVAFKCSVGHANVPVLFSSNSSTAKYH